jgi:nicotinate-nucleotide adenylyltransferase
MRLGLLGGTFDPIHVGHLDVASAARDALALDEVWLLPSAIPPHRQPPHAPAADRFAMAELAAREASGFVASDVELHGSGPSYTSATLDRLEASGVQVDQSVFITGADAFRDIATWKDYPRILDRCHFAVVSRPGAPVDQLRTLLPSLAARMVDGPGAIGSRPSIFLIDAPTADVSSTGIRQRVAAGASIDGLVPPAVAAYIARHGLYRQQDR